MSRNSWFLSLIMALSFFAAISPASAQIPLGTASNFGVLGGSAVTNTGPTIVNGNLGVSPGSAVTGFPPGLVAGGTIHLADAVAMQAQNDLTVAYNTAAGLACGTDLTGQDLGGQTLTPGVYCFSSSAQLTGTLTLDALGNPNAQFVFKMGSTLTTASGAAVVFVNGGGSCNLFWQVGSSATLGTGTSFAGNILSLQSITMTTGASVAGRLLARNGAVTLDSNTVSPCQPGICPTITVGPKSLPAAMFGVLYSQALLATGGNAPYTFSVSSGALPPGLSMSNSGLISGTPTATGTFNFTVLATDANGCPGSRSYVLVITGGMCPTVTVNPAILPPATAGMPYSQTISATGGIAPYQYTVSAGVLPNGLMLNSTTGLISGTPTAGTFNFSITATDVNNCPGTRAYIMVITGGMCPTVTVNPVSLPPATAGMPYSQTISATGGIAPYQYTVSAGVLPNGLMLNSTTGLISGTPTAGTFNFSITATDVNNCPGTRAYIMVITGGMCPTVTVNPVSLPPAPAGVPYAQTISATGGIAPYQYIVSAGALPNGLMLNGTTGLISGTPTAGTFNFSITATDVNNCPGTRAYTQVITGVCPLISISPPTLPAAIAGSPYSQLITATGGTAPYTFAVTTGALPAGLSLNSASGLISGTPSVAGGFNFTITATDANGCQAIQAYALQSLIPSVISVPALSRQSIFALIVIMLAATSATMLRRR